MKNPREYILITVLLLYSCTPSALLHHSNTTYQRDLPSGRTVVCDLCPPGHRLQKHCTETQPTACQPCAKGLYTEYWNYIYECLPCSLCSSDQVVVQECTGSRDRVCECKEGFYRQSYYCQPHTVCPSGHGVREKGTPVKDTTCERCQWGFYSNGRQPCVPHAQCAPDGKLLLHGTRHADSVCVSCSQIQRDGWVKYIIEHFLVVFRNFSKSGSRKLTRFIGQLTETKDCSSDQDGCFLQLRQWFDAASEQDVGRLPKALQEHNIKNLTAKIEQKIKRIQDEVRLCRNTLPDHK